MINIETSSKDLHSFFGETWKVVNQSDWISQCVTEIQSDINNGPVYPVYTASEANQETYSEVTFIQFRSLTLFLPRLIG